MVIGTLKDERLNELMVNYRNAHGKCYSGGAGKETMRLIKRAEGRFNGSAYRSGHQSEKADLNHPLRSMPAATPIEQPCWP